MSGFEHCTTEVLLVTRERLRRGLDRVAEHTAAGTFHTLGPKGEASPAQSGQTTRIFLELVEAELARREGATP